MISLEQVKANPRGLSPRPSKASVAVEQDKRIVLRNLGEFLDVLSRCHPDFSTSHAWAMDCIHVPIIEINWPMK